MRHATLPAHRPRPALAFLIPHTRCLDIPRAAADAATSKHCDTPNSVESAVLLVVLPSHLAQLNLAVDSVPLQNPVEDRLRAARHIHRLGVAVRPELLLYSYDKR